VKTTHTVVSIFEAIGADRPDHAPTIKVDVPSAGYGDLDLLRSCVLHGT
jgi:hypothetical protein